MTVRYCADASRAALTPVDNRFLLEYLPHADGTAVKVYLYGLMQCAFSSTAEPDIAEALGLSAEAVTDAFRYWQTQGLVRIRAEEPLIVEYLSLAPSDAPAVLTGRYAKLVDAINQLTAPRQFDARELRHVYDWVEVFSLDEDAVLELVSHCMDVKGRRVSVNYMSTVAQAWAEQGIRTRADALNYVNDYKLRHHGASAILRQWNKRRKPTVPEMALYDKWTGEWGFTQETILSVLPKLNTAGTPNFTYLDELLDDLRTSGRVDKAEIEADDAKSAGERAFAKLVFERAGKAEPATKTQRAQISMYVDQLHMPRELLLYGAELCRGANEPFGRMKKLWSEWQDAGVTDIEQAEAYQKTHATKPAARGSKPPAYEQHDLTDEQLDALLTDLDRDL